MYRYTLHSIVGGFFNSFSIFSGFLYWSVAFFSLFKISFWCFWWWLTACCLYLMTCELDVIYTGPWRRLCSPNARDVLAIGKSGTIAERPIQSMLEKASLTLTWHPLTVIWKSKCTRMPRKCTKNPQKYDWAYVTNHTPIYKIGVWSTIYSRSTSSQRRAESL